MKAQMDDLCLSFGWNNVRCDIEYLFIYMKIAERNIIKEIHIMKGHAKYKFL